jgi:DNA-binding NarL/FixJ family response regulator
MTAALLVRPRQSELTVAVVDDHPVSALLSLVDGITLVPTPEAADVLIVGSVAALHRARRSAPDAAALVITASDDGDSVFGAMRAGARGYLLEDASRDDLVRAIRGVAAGEMILGPAIAARLTELMIRQSQPARHPFPDLTTREREILDLIAQGKDNGTIARQLFLAPKTVRNNISLIFSKLGVAGRSAAIVRAREAGIGLD